MKYSIIFLLFLIKFCESNDFECGVSDDLKESVEFYCTDYTGVKPENCSETFLYSTCRYDRFKVKNLKIGGCDSNEVTKLVEEFENLCTLDLSYSAIVSLDTFKLKHGNLKKLNMSHNHLLEIPSNFFQALSELNEIDLSFNDISKIDELPKKLEKIDVSNNKISLYTILKNRASLC